MRKPDRSRIKYNEEALREASKRLQLPHGWHPFIITKTEETVGDKGKIVGNLMVRTECAALKNPDDPTSIIKPIMREGFPVPLDNPDVPGHKAPDWSYGICARFLRSVYDESELARAPYRVNGEMTYKGKVIKKEDENKYREDALREVVKKAEKLYFDGSQDLKSRIFLGKVGFDKTKEWTNIIDMRHIDRGLPDGESFAVAESSGPSSKPRARRKKVSKKKKKGRR